MQGRKSQQLELISTINMEIFIPSDHLLRKFDRLIGDDFIREITEKFYCLANGRPSIDPSIIFRMMIISYLYGIDSDRRLCEEVKLNIAYRWFVGLGMEDKTPDHSSLSKLRAKYGEKTFHEIFKSIIRFCKGKGILRGNRIITDASFIEANASLDSLEEKKEGEKNLKPLKRYEKKYKSFRDGEKQRRIANQTHLSKSDPDSTMVARDGYHRKLLHKVHSSIDAKIRIIVDAFVTTGAFHESRPYLERLGYLENQFKFKIKEVIADQGYGFPEILKTLSDKNINTIIPLQTKSALNNDPNLVYEKEHDRFKCLNDQYLYPNKGLHGGSKRYRVVGKNICRSYPLKEKCIQTNFKKFRNKFVYRHEHYDLLEKISKDSETEEFKQKMIERKWKIEGIFAEGKNSHRLRKSILRGREKVQIHAHMTSIVQNLKRLVDMSPNFSKFFLLDILW